MFEDIKKRVYKANIELVKKGLVYLTWGNVSEVDRKKGVIVIKPSGIEYDSMKEDDMVVVDLLTGKVVEGKYKPSSDTPTHLALYRAFLDIGGIAHTHSVNAVAFAQAGLDIPILGTTHADHFCDSIPCTRGMTQEEVDSEYELNTGLVIAEEVLKRGHDILSVPGIVVKNHGPFSWGKNAEESVLNAVVLEKVAEMDIKTLLINKDACVEKYLIDKHFSRKHGPKSYYGQKTK